ncbi:MAG: STAS domain-containing protein, partial [Pseudomonadota bacterium]
MEFIHNLSQGIYSVTLSGKFNFDDRPEFRLIIQKIAEQEVKQVVLNMEKVDSVDSASLGMLLLARDEAK